MLDAVPCRTELTLSALSLASLDPQQSVLSEAWCGVVMRLLKPGWQGVMIYCFIIPTSDPIWSSANAAASCPAPHEALTPKWKLPILGRGSDRSVGYGQTPCGEFWPS
ncbi:hypothetical protein BaRGS_00012084, partial [Batillaria attramentaria]